MKEEYLIFIICIVLFSKCKSQSDMISNKKIEYSIVMISSQYDETDNTLEPSKEIVIPKLDTQQISYLRDLDKIGWQKNLESRDTDFATNLILYSIFELDYTANKTFDENGWRNSLKEKEIELWNEKLFQLDSAVIEDWIKNTLE